MVSRSSASLERRLRADPPYHQHVDRASGVGLHRGPLNVGQVAQTMDRSEQPNLGLAPDSEKLPG